MMNFGRSVNRIVIPEMSESLVLTAVAKAEKEFIKNKEAERKSAVDFYYNDNIGKHLEQWFSGDSLSQVPTYPQKVVPRFARARMMLYKSPPIRYIKGEEDTEYKEYAYQLDSMARLFSELAWLLGDCHVVTRYNERKTRLEYEVLPFVKEYFINGDSEPFGYSWEIDKGDSSKRMFIFWSETRDGVQGMHFKFNQDGKRFTVNGNPEMVNPYDVVPVSRVCYPSHSFDVVVSAVQIGIAMTELALNVRFKLGQPVFTGIDEGQSTIKSGIDNAIILPEGATFQYVTPGAGMVEMIEAIKLFANQTAENNHLRIRWGESGGNSPSGEALRILEIENMESRESDIPLFREWEHNRYEIDRKLLEVHGVITLNENYSVDFGEVTFPMSPQEERAWLDWKLAKGIITKRDLLLYFNPDMTDEELEKKLTEVQEEKLMERETEQLEQPVFQGLNRLGAVGT